MPQAAAPRHAVCIAAHADAPILAELVNALDDPRNDIYIMLDKKSDPADFAHITASRSTLVWCHGRTKVYWGDLSLVANEINLLDEARTGGGYTRFHLISGIDMPIKSQDEIHAFFDSLPRAEFITYDPEGSYNHVIEARLGQLHLFSKHFRDKPGPRQWIYARLRGLGRRLQALCRYKRRYTFGKLMPGSNWVSLTPQAVDLIVSNRRRILRDFRHTLCPDEIYKQSLIWESPLRANISPQGNMRLIDWKRGDPYVFDEADFDELIASPCMFARKCTLPLARKLNSHFARQA